MVYEANVLDENMRYDNGYRYKGMRKLTSDNLDDLLQEVLKYQPLSARAIDQIHQTDAKHPSLDRQTPLYWSAIVSITKGEITFNNMTDCTSF